MAQTAMKQALPYKQCDFDRLKDGTVRGSDLKSHACFCKVIQDYLIHIDLNIYFMKKNSINNFFSSFFYEENTKQI